MKEETMISRKSKLAKIAKKHNLQFIILFGSKARGEKQNEESDLDIAVLAKKEPAYRQYMNIYGDIADLFQGENADVGSLNNSDLLFRFQVVKDGILLYGDERAYREYKLLTIRRYADDGIRYFPMLDKLVYERLALLEKNL